MYSSIEKIIHALQRTNFGVYRVSFGCEYNCLSAQCQISIAANMIRGINPHIKLHCNVFGIDNVMPLKVIAVGHTQTDSRQPQYNSFLTDLRLN